MVATVNKAVAGLVKRIVQGLRELVLLELPILLRSLRRLFGREDRVCEPRKRQPASDVGPGVNAPFLLEDLASRDFLHERLGGIDVNVVGAKQPLCEIADDREDRPDDPLALFRGELLVRLRRCLFGFVGFEELLTLGICQDIVKREMESLVENRFRRSVRRVE